LFPHVLDTPPRVSQETPPKELVASRKTNHPLGRRGWVFQKMEHMLEMLHFYKKMLGYMTSNYTKTFEPGLYAGPK
jgi:hypothetical protein